MTSKRQEAANRRNALRSTGPNTPQGKENAKMNALRHGLRAETLVLPDEDPAEFDRFQQALIDELAPGGELEAVLVERIIVLAWRLRRVGQIEARVFVYCDQLQVARAARDKAVGIRKKLENQLGNQLTERPFLPEDQQACRQAVLEAEQAERQAEASRPPQSGAFGGNDNLLANVSRYETTLERSLFKSLHELERLQARRAGQAVAPPVVVDVNLDVQQDAP